jgi:hypothetical protein
MLTPALPDWAGLQLVVVLVSNSARKEPRRQATTIAFMFYQLAVPNIIAVLKGVKAGVQSKVVSIIA